MNRYLRWDKLLGSGENCLPNTKVKARGCCPLQPLVRNGRALTG